METSAPLPSSLNGTIRQNAGKNERKRDMSYFFQIDLDFDAVNPEERQFQLDRHS